MARTIASSIKVVGRFARQSGLSQVTDVYPEWGCAWWCSRCARKLFEQWALVVACDFPLVTTNLFARMHDLSRDSDAVAPVQADGVPQPLCTLYRVDPCLAQAEQLIKSGERKPIALLQSVRTRWIDFERLSDLEGSESFLSINTPEDYARIATGESDRIRSNDDSLISFVRILHALIMPRRRLGKKLLKSLRQSC